MVRRRLHWSHHGKPWCRRDADYARLPLPPNTTTQADEVTCVRCLRGMASVARRLTPKKARR